LIFLAASKFPESFTQAQGGDDCYENYGDGADGIDDDDYDEENSVSLKHFSHFHIKAH